MVCFETNHLTNTVRFKLLLLRELSTYQLKVFTSIEKVEYFSL